MEIKKGDHWPGTEIQMPLPDRGINELRKLDLEVADCLFPDKALQSKILSVVLQQSVSFIKCFQNIQSVP